MMPVPRPVMRWHGGKWRLAPWIITHMPPHVCYVEPFGGAASVLLRKPALAAECYNDLDATVVTVFRVMRDPAAAAELDRRLRLTPYARSEFEWSYEPPSDDVDLAHKSIVRSFMGHGSDSVTRNCRTGFRAKMSDSRAFPAQTWANYASAVPFFTRRLMGTVIEASAASEVIARYDSPSTLFYVDPPYLHSTRSSLVGRSHNTHGYRHEMDDDAHGNLLGQLTSLRGMVVLSAYPSSVYDNALLGWRRVCREVYADGGRIRTEVLWLNQASVAGLGDGPLFSNGQGG